MIFDFVSRYSGLIQLLGVPLLINTLFGAAGHSRALWLLGARELHSCGALALAPRRSRAKRSWSEGEKGKGWSSNASVNNALRPLLRRRAKRELGTFLNFRWTWWAGSRKMRSAAAGAACRWTRTKREGGETVLLPSGTCRHRLSQLTHQKLMHK